MDKLYKFSMPQFPHLQNTSIKLIEQSLESNDIKFIKSLAQYLAYSENSINLTYFVISCHCLSPDT